VDWTAGAKVDWRDGESRVEVGNDVMPFAVRLAHPAEGEPVDGEVAGVSDLDREVIRAGLTRHREDADAHDARAAVHADEMVRGRQPVRFVRPRIDITGQ